MKSVKKIPHLKGVPVLVRAALNVPVKNGVVQDRFRLTSALPTIEFLCKKGAKVILIGHLGDTGTESLRPVCEALRDQIPHIVFCPSTIGKEARAAVRALRPGDVLMLENLRWQKGEKDNDADFAAELASLADVFVEDSFDVCHRKHASVVGVPKLLPSYAGFLVLSEVAALKKAGKPGRNSLAIIGGAKFSTKEPVLTALLASYDYVFVGGALANDFLRAEGHSVGLSLVSQSDSEHMRSLASSKKLLLPVDAIVAPLTETGGKGTVVPVEEVPDDTAMLDVGEETIALLAPLIRRAKTVLWNGPLGRYENGFTKGTQQLALEITRSHAKSILGGGDTVAALDALGLTQKFSFVSTGGGAMLDYLAYGTLPGLDALS